MRTVKKDWESFVRFVVLRELDPFFPSWTYFSIWFTPSIGWEISTAQYKYPCLLGFWVLPWIFLHFSIICFVYLCLGLSCLMTIWGHEASTLLNIVWPMQKNGYNGKSVTNFILITTFLWEEQPELNLSSCQPLMNPKINHKKKHTHTPLKT